MLSAEGSIQVGATPRQVLELVCDLRAYMALDGKIVKVHENPPLDADGRGFVVDPVDGGSLVTHSYRFRFKRPFGLLIERYGRDWLQQDLEDELKRIKEHFGSGFERR